MTFKAIFTAAAVSALMAGAAYAQSSNMPADTASGAPATPPSDSSTMTTSVNPVDKGASASTTTTTETAPAAGSYGQAASVTTSLTTNGPVPDTPENRAKYGQPLSHAGKRTAPRGN